MPTMKPTVYKKDMASLLSADAAEFVPQGCAPHPTNSTAASHAGTSWKGEKPMGVTEVPRYLTSCYPFVSQEDVGRHHIQRFPQPCPYTGGMPPSLPLPVNSPIRFPTWQAPKLSYLDNFQPTSYGSMPFDLLTSLPVDMFSVRGDCLLSIPPKMEVPAPPPPSGQGMLLAQHPDTAASWIMTVPPPMFLQQYQQQQQLHSPQQQQPHLTVKTSETPYKGVTSNGTIKHVGRSKVMVDSLTQREAKQADRPQSPVLISRSSQTDISPHVRNFTLEERPHPLYLSQGKKDQSVSSRSGTTFDGHEWKVAHEDSDSGYNSPMHKHNLVSNGTQAVPSRMPSDNSSRLTETAGSSTKSRKNLENSQTNHTATNAGQGRTDGRVSVKSEVRNHLNDNLGFDGNKKMRNKKDHRDATRSPRLLGSNSKFLSRSSSSVSSSGTKPDEDDEKIDLHSWTDFPPMSSRVAPLSTASKPPSLKSPLIADERVALTIERSAHEPPWSIKFSSVDQTRSERSRSSSGEMETSPRFHSPAESAWGKIGRSFRNSQSSGLGKELSLLMTSSETVPLLSISGRSSFPGDGLTSTACIPAGLVLKGTSALMNRDNSSRGELKHSPEIATKRRSNNGGEVVERAFQGKGDICCVYDTGTINTKHASSPITHLSVLSASLSLPRSATTTTTASNICFGGGFVTTTNTTTGSRNKEDVLLRTGPHVNTNPSLPPTLSNSNHAIVIETARGNQHAGQVHGLVNASIRGMGPGTENTFSRTDDSNQSGATNPATFMKAGSGTSNQPVLSSLPFPTSSSSVLQQPTSVINPAAVPVVAIRPGLPGAAFSINYHIPPPSQVPPGASSRLNPAFTSYTGMAQGLYSTKSTSPGYLPRGTSNQTIHQVASPFQAGSISFILQPPPTFVPSASSCSYFPGSVPYQPPLPVPPGMVTNITNHRTDLALQPPGLATVAQRGSDLCVASLAVNTTQCSSVGPASHSVISPTSKIQDRRAGSTVDASIQQQFSHEQKPHNSPDGIQDSSKVDGNEKRRRRRRRRTRARSKLGGKDTEDGDGGSDGSRVLDCAFSSSNVSESTLHFEDVDEFPDLLTSAVRGHSEDVGERATLSGTSITYSDILKSTWSKAGSQSRTQSLTGSCVSGDIDDEDNTSCHTGTTNESKRARKRRKRREQANKAAEVELAEISLEQQWLKEVGLKKSASHRAGEAGVSARSTPGLITDSYVISESKRLKGGEKKSQQPIALDIAAMIDAIQKKPGSPTDSYLTNPAGANLSARGSKKELASTNSISSSLPGNILDSSAPLQKRGKEREIGKAKKPSPLKKVILKEREQRKRLRLLDEDPDSVAGLGTVGTSSGVGIVGGESELSQDALSSKSGDTDGEDTNGAAELSADFSPISQTSPISMSPASPGNSGVNSPVTGSVGRDPVVMKIHSRRFREYCTQILDKEIDQCCMSLLQDLVKFQDRMFHKDPVKAKTKRRVVLGLREVTKHLKLKKIKCVVISPNVEKIQSKGGLDEALNNILNMCREQDVPFVFALGRRALGRACAKLVPVSVVGIFNYEGCESRYRSLISLTAAARTAYNEMVLEVEKEVAEYPTMASQTSSIGGVPGLFAAHMGHSRTPSGCSAISFTSSILSEPISENFPHAEPEVDSKGYEIVRDAAGNVVHPSRPVAGSKLRGGLTTDIDDGNEADTEDFCEIRKKKRVGRPLNSVRFGDVGYVNDGKIGVNNGNDKNCDASVDVVSDDADERSTIGKLSRNVSELTLTNEDNFILKGEPYALKHKSSLEDFEDDIEDFEDDKDVCDDEVGQEDEANIYGDSESPLYNKWGRVSHIDSIHSQNYNLGDEIFSHHSPQSHDSKNQSVTFGRHSQLSPSSLGGGGGVGSEGLHVGQTSSFDDKDDDVDNNIDNDDDVEEENEAADRHHRVIDKERIKNWLESQSNISTED